MKDSRHATVTSRLVPLLRVSSLSGCQNSVSSSDGIVELALGDGLCCSLVSVRAGCKGTLSFVRRGCSIHVSSLWAANALRRLASSKNLSSAVVFKGSSRGSFSTGTREAFNERRSVVEHVRVVLE